jgi:hypothetical protein
MTELGLATVRAGNHNRRVFPSLIAALLCSLFLLTSGAAKAEDKAPLILDSYETALKLKQAGNCEDAVKILEQLAAQGHGHERAGLNLAQCKLVLAEKAATPEAAHDMLQDAVRLVILAANAGLDDAQIQLVKLTINGGHFKVEPVEAGAWYLIWKRNPTRLQLGGSAVDRKLVEKLQNTLTPEDWNKAQAQADAFVPLQ